MSHNQTMFYSIEEVRKDEMIAGNREQASLGECRQLSRKMYETGKGGLGEALCGNARRFEGEECNVCRERRSRIRRFRDENSGEAKENTGKVLDRHTRIRFHGFVSRIATFQEFIGL